MAFQSLELLEMLREEIARGDGGRDQLLHFVAVSLREQDDAGDVALSDSGRRDLLDWIDLARHLFG
jgi:hypothetical protein